MFEVLSGLLTIGVVLVFCFSIWFISWLINKILTNRYKKRLLEIENKYPTFYQKQEELRSIEWGTSYGELKEIENQIDDLYKELNYALREDCPKIEEKIKNLKETRKKKKEQFELAKEQIQKIREEIKEIKKSNPELEKFYSF